MSRFRRIMVAVDGSPGSDKALDEAIRLAQTVGARLRLIHVIEQMRWVNGIGSARAPFDDALLRMRETGEKLLARGLGQAITAQVEAESELVIESAGRICDNLADEAKRWGADLIVAGTQGRHGVDRLLLGSVAEQIVRHAGVPVLLVRPTSAAP